MNGAAAITLEENEGGIHEFCVDRREAERSLVDILSARGFPLNTRCGQRGLCHGCEIELTKGALEIGGALAKAPALLQACRARVPERGNAVLRIPARSRIELEPQVSETFHTDVPCGRAPLFEVANGRDTAFAVDVGTTTVVVLLVDLATGRVLSRAGGFNAQIRFGDNVLTRIDTARNPGALVGMQAAVTSETITPLLLRACELAGREPSRLSGGAVAGNTTMLHLLAGEDPSPLGVAPFRARFLHGRRLHAAAAGLAGGRNGDALAREMPLQLLPGIAAYIGADITAGIWATGMVFDPAPSLLVDIGTNGEIVLQNGGRLTACATAAGPAFEGAGLSCGARARNGAISDIDLSLAPFQVETKLIGGAPPGRASGICGSAYLDFLSVARAQGLLREAGRFDPAAWERVPAAWRIETEEGLALRIAGQTKISEVDIALLLQAKAAIGAGIETLLDNGGLAANDISRVYLAGGFGMHLNVGHAIAIGLLPGFREEQVRVVGNTALAGALIALLDRTALDDMEALRSRVEVLELNLQEGFEDRYIDHLMLP